MRKLVFVLFTTLCLLAVNGCQTAKNTALGVGGIAKGLADDAYNTYKAIDKADKWFQEKYW